MELNELKTIESSPAHIEFNHKEIEKDLEENLKKYTGLTFTEEDAAECKRTIAELRKGKKAVDEYRKEKKKELSAPISEFEEKCKALNKKFDEVINPLVEQSNEFEEKRKQEKREQVEQSIAELIEQYDLIEKYATQMAADDSHLTKSKTMKSINEELETQASHLKMQQDKEESDKQVISSTVQYINSSYGVSMSENPYTSLLDYKDIKQIKQQIMDDGQEEADRLLQEKQRQERREKEAQERREREEQQEQAVKEAEPEPIEVEPEKEPFAPDDELDIPDPFSQSERTYQVKASAETLEELEVFMNEKGIVWEVVN